MTKEQRKLYMREYYKTHRKEIIARNSAYNKEHKKELSAKRKESRHKDMEKTRRINNEYYSKNKERINARRKELRDMKKSKT